MPAYYNPHEDSYDRLEREAQEAFAKAEKARKKKEAREQKEAAKKAAKERSQASLQRTLKAHIDRRIVTGNLDRTLVAAWLKTTEKPRSAYLGLAWELLNSPIYGIRQDPQGRWVYAGKTHDNYQDVQRAIEGTLGQAPFDFLPSFLVSIGNGTEEPEVAIRDALAYQEPLGEPEDLTMEDAIALRVALGSDPLDPIKPSNGDQVALEMDWEETTTEEPEEVVNLTQLDPETLTVAERLERLDQLASRLT